MERKLVILLVLMILVLPLVASIPQFLIFQGDVKVDGRTASEGTLIKFSINGVQIASSSVNSIGEYGPVMIQGFSQYYGDRISITINGYIAQNIVYYVYPQDINLDLSALTERVLRISNYFPIENNLEHRTGNYTFNILTQTGYSDIVNHTWFLDGNKVSEVTNTNFSFYIYERTINDTSQHEISVIARDGYLTVSKNWILSVKKEEISVKKIRDHDIRQIKEFCYTNWQCSKWSSCSNEIMTRDCVDTNRCTFSYNKPAESTYCGNLINPSLIQNGNNDILFTLIAAFLILISIMIVGMATIAIKKRTK